MPPRGPPTKPEQLDYLVQWFLEYSDVQKDDFLLILVEKFSRNEEDELSDTLKILTMNENDQPPSIFQCRMKLFIEWFTNWSDEEKSELLSRIGIVDEQFIQRFHDCTEVIPNNKVTIQNDKDDLQNHEDPVPNLA